MKKIFLTIFMLSALCVVSQQSGQTTLESLRREKNKTLLKQKINTLENGTDEDLSLLIQYYEKDSTNRKRVTKMLLKKFPDSQHARMQRMRSFLNAKGNEGTEALLQQMIKDNPGVNLDMEKSMLSSLYAEEPNANKVMNYINSMEDSVFRVVALTMAADLMAAIDNAKALQLVISELENAKRLKGRTTLTGPLKIDPTNTYYQFIDLLGKLYFRTGNYEQSYLYTAEAYNNSKNKDGELIENYAFLSSLRGEYKEALPILSKAVKEGKFDQQYVDQVKKGYTALYPGKDADAYVTELKGVFIDKIKKDVSKLLIKEAAPAFSVTDINGKKVSLADFKGKTLVLDFWATWCGPCVASFPAMQMAANRYTNDPAVKFLFIHTWENVADPLTDAKKFLAKRDYNFDLYMDTRDPITKHSPAADAFKIDGIPAKFIIDGNGNVRFKVSGFDGKAESAAEEVVQMVEMARKNA